MSKIQDEELQRANVYYESLVMDNIYNLEKASMALDQLLDEYQWDYEPSAYDAIKFGRAVGNNRAECTDNEKRSWNYIEGYKKIMWLVGVARDYCFSALTDCEKAYKGGVVNE